MLRRTFLSLCAAAVAPVKWLKKKPVTYTMLPPTKHGGWSSGSTEMQYTVVNGGPYSALSSADLEPRNETRVLWVGDFVPRKS